MFQLLSNSYPRTRPGFSIIRAISESLIFLHWYPAFSKVFFLIDRISFVSSAWFLSEPVHACLVRRKHSLGWFSFLMIREQDPSCSYKWFLLRHVPSQHLFSSLESIFQCFRWFRSVLLFQGMPLTFQVVQLFLRAVNLRGVVSLMCFVDIPHCVETGQWLWWDNPLAALLPWSLVLRFLSIFRLF